MNRPKRLGCRTFMGLLLCAVLLGGCGSGAEPDETTVQTPTRFVNAVVGVPTPLGLDLAEPEGLAREKIPFGGATGYENVDTGDTTFTANQSGTTGQVLSEAVSLDGAKSRTVIAAGVSGSPDATLSPRLETLDDPALPSAIGTNAAVRLIVVATGLEGPVDLFKDTAAVVGAGNVTAGNPTGYAVVAVGTGLKIKDTATGTDLNLARLSAATLTAGKAYTIVVIGRKADGYPGDVTGLDTAILADN